MDLTLSVKRYDAREQGDTVEFLFLRSSVAAMLPLLRPDCVYLNSSTARELERFLLEKFSA